jgi:hypothetical protein
VRGRRGVFGCRVAGGVGFPGATSGSVKRSVFRFDVERGLAIQNTACGNVPPGVGAEANVSTGNGNVDMLCP